MLPETKTRGADIQSLAGLGSGFLSLITHEIRTPLAAAASSAELLSMRHETWNPEKRSRAIARMSTSLHKIDEILDGVSFAERVASGRAGHDVAPVRVSEVASACVGDEIPVVPDAAERSVQLPAEALSRTIRHLLAYLLPESSGKASARTFYRMEDEGACVGMKLTADLDTEESSRRLCAPEAQRQNVHLRLARVLAALHGWKISVRGEGGATVSVTVTVQGACNAFR